MLVSALNQQAMIYDSKFETTQHKLRNLRVHNDPNILVNQSSQQPIGAQPSLSAAQVKPSPLVNKQTKILAKYTKASQKQQVVCAQSETPATISKSPVKTPTQNKANPCRSVAIVPALTPRKCPNQMVTEDFTQDFKGTKVCNS